MFADVYKRKMEKWEKIVTQSVLNAYQDDGWENVYVNEIVESDYNKYIAIVRLNEIFGMARKMLNNQKFHKPIHTLFLLESKADDNFELYTIKTGQTRTLKVVSDNDLIFLKECPDDTIRQKAHKPHKPHRTPKSQTSEDPLRTWCQQFLREYAQNGSVDESIEHTPSYTPSQSQLTKLQKKREKDLLQWGSNF